MYQRKLRLVGILIVLLVIATNVSDAFPAKRYEDVEWHGSCLFSSCECYTANDNGVWKVKIDCSSRMRRLDFRGMHSLRNVEMHTHSQNSNMTRHRRYEQQRLTWAPTQNNSIVIMLDLRRNGFGKISNQFLQIEQDMAQSITELDLSYNSIRSINVQAFRSLSVLEILKIKYNLIRNIPDLSTLYHLQVLDLQNNYLLKVLPANHLPKQISELLLAGIPIRHISRELLQNQTNLKILDISDGIGTEIRQRTIDDNAFHDLYNLTILTMSYTQWQRHLSVELFRNLNNLRIIRARRCYLRSGLPLINSIHNIPLEEIDLSGNHFNTESITSENFPNLQRLYLNYTKIVKFPQNAFQAMPNLSELHISGVNLRRASLDVLDNHQSIRYLDISYNRLSNFPMLSPQIEHLNVKGNKLTNITRRTFSRANSLLTLDLSDQHIDAIEDFAFFDDRSLVEKKLQHLNLKGNHLSHINMHALMGLENLKQLNLEGNSLQTLPEMFPLPSLEILNLSKNNLTIIHPDVFVGLLNLHNLDISDNKIAQIEFHSDLPNLHYLKLNNNNLESVTSVSRMPSLQTLSLSNNNITEITRETFTNCCLSLEVLQLNSNRISSIQAGSFQNLQNLTELDICYNKGIFPSYQAFVDLGNLKWLKLISSNIETFPNVTLPNLKHIHIYQNKISSLGTVPLNVLMPEIEELDLSSNHLNHIEVGLFDGLRKLTIIDLKYNQFICNCATGEDIYTQTHNYVKDWLEDFAVSEQADPSMLKEIQADKKSRIPAYYCTKNHFNIMSLFADPCTHAANLNMENYLQEANLENYVDYIAGITNITEEYEDTDYDPANYGY